MTHPDPKQSGEQIARLTIERDFLLIRAGHAGSASFGPGRWTGMSSNALVTIAFGGEDNCLPSDAGDLASCYRLVQRLPEHLKSPAVFAHLAKGEAHVEGRYPGSIAWAKAETAFTGAA